MTQDFADFALTCPMPIQHYPQVLLAHGGGGRLMHQLIETMFLPVFGNNDRPQHDAASLQLPGQRIAFTTDSYVVRPLFFPGGNIGSLAVHGTVNDLAMAGARPLYLSVGFILEEGLPMETLWRIVNSMQQAARQSQVEIVTGDTKVVDRGKGDGIFINTAGVGIIEHSGTIAPSAVKPGDIILLNGDLGRHGIAIMAAREGLEFETTIESDSAPLADSVGVLLEAGIEIHCLRDLTRGGLATTLHEIAAAAQVLITIDETRIPVQEQVQGACEILGLDPLYIANEGRFIAIVPCHDSDRALGVLRHYQQQTEGNATACVIGEVGEVKVSQRKERSLSSASSGWVTLNNRLGSQRMLDLLSGEQLPRIC